MSAETADDVARRLRALIHAQDLQPGEKLGSERALAESFGISRALLRLALAKLEESHEIVRKIGRGGGIVISDGKLERSLNTVESLTQIARRQGWRLTSTVLSAALSTAAESDRRLLALPQERPMIYAITRLRMLNGTPLSVEVTHLPAYRFTNFLDLDLTTSFYGHFECEYGIRPKFVDETLDYTTADARQAELLDIAPGGALLRIRRVAADASGVPCERAVDTYLAERMRFTMHHSGFVRLSATRDDGHGE